MSWENRVIERRKVRIGDIRVNKWNPRSHPKVQQERLRATLDKFGIIGDLIAFKDDDGEWTLFDGHARQKLDPDQEWMVSFTSLTRSEVDELVLLFDPLAALARQEADKTMALMAGLEVQERALKEMLQEQAQALGFTFGGNGGGEVVDSGESPIGRAEELQKVWQVSVGDVWQIGPHHLICGDCREPETWKRLLSAAGVTKVNGVFTSPPYAMQRAKQYGGVPVAQYVDWWEAVQANVRANLARDGSFFVNIKPHCEDGQRVLYVFDLVLAMVRKWGWRFVDELCWVHQGVAGYWPNRFKNGFEPVFQFALSEKQKFFPGSVKCPAAESTLARIETAKRSGEVGAGRRVSSTGSNFGIDYGNMEEFDGMAIPSNAIRVSSETTNVGHAAAFPTALPDFFVKAYSDEGDIWLDPFVGSGTTLVAAHQNERRGLGIELLPKYCAVVLERLQSLGLEPKRVGHT